MSDLSRLPEPSPEADPPPPDRAAQPDAKAPQTAPVTRPRRTRGWIWFFLALVVLSVVAVTTIVVYRWNQILTPQRLEAARKLWQERGPKDYEFRYKKRIGRGAKPSEFDVMVRGGKVQSVTLDRNIQLPKRQLESYSMEALFDDIEKLLEMDSKPNQPRPTTMAQFDPTDGHLLNYVRGGMGTQEQVSILVEQFKKLDGGAR